MDRISHKEERERRTTSAEHWPLGVQVWAGEKVKWGPVFVTFRRLGVHTHTPRQYTVFLSAIERKKVCSASISIWVCPELAIIVFLFCFGMSSERLLLRSGRNNAVCFTQLEWNYATLKRNNYPTLFYFQLMTFRCWWSRYLLNLPTHRQSNQQHSET